MLLLTLCGLGAPAPVLADTFAGAGWFHETHEGFTDIIALGYDVAPGVGSLGVVDSLRVRCIDGRFVVGDVWDENAAFSDDPLGSMKITSRGPYEGIEFILPVCSGDFDDDDVVVNELRGLTMSADATITPTADPPTPYGDLSAGAFGSSPYVGADAGFYRPASAGIETAGNDAYGPPGWGEPYAAFTETGAGLGSDSAAMALRRDLRGESGQASQVEALRAIAFRAAARR